MNSIQTSALIYFTLVTVGAWIFFAIIFLQLKNFLHISSRAPLISKLISIMLVVFTVIGYLIIFFFETIDVQKNPENTPAAQNNNFDTY